MSIASTINAMNILKKKVIAKITILIMEKTIMIMQQKELNLLIKILRPQNILILRVKFFMMRMI